MALNFPSLPSANATYTFNDKTWTYIGNAWYLTSGGALSTSVVPEGTNLYFSNARVYSNVFTLGYATNANVVLKANVTDLTTANVTEVTNLYFSNARVYSNVSTLGYATTTNVALKANIADLTTANVTEKTNLYFSNARAISAIVNTSLSNITVSGNITVSSMTASSSITSPVIYSNSDRRLKTNIAPINNALEKIKSLDGVYFTWINNQQNSLGLIAQNVEMVEPLAVVDSPEGFKTVNYLSLIGILIEAIKEQQVQIDMLNSKVNNL